jgi:hypothetical protein
MDPVEKQQLRTKLDEVFWKILRQDPSLNFTLNERRLSTSFYSMDYMNLTIDQPKLELIEFIKENLSEEFSKGFFFLNFTSYISNYLYKVDKNLELDLQVVIEEKDSPGMVFETVLGHYKLLVLTKDESAIEFRKEVSH